MKEKITDLIKTARDTKRDIDIEKLKKDVAELKKKNKEKDFIEREFEKEKKWLYED